MTAPYTVGELVAARSILAALPRDLPPEVVACVLDSIAALERAQDLLTGETHAERERQIDDFAHAHLARSGR
jgi:hypothetical protein